MKRWKCGKALALGFSLLILVPSMMLRGETQPPLGIEEKRIAELTSPAKVVRYVRDRFEIPETVKVGAAPVQRSRFPHFFQTTVTVDDGKQKRSNSVFITDDARCFAAGQVFALNGAANAELIRCVREAAALPPSAEVGIGAFAATPLNGFLKSTITVKVGARTDQGELFVTRDHRVGVLGLVLPFRPDFVEQLIDTRNQPGVGPTRAPVTIVEYADLECQYCALMQKFLENDFLPKYGTRARLVFKEFPLSFHDWSTSAALANECAFQIDSSTFFNYRNQIFGNQTNINAANVRDRLLSLGEQAGLDRSRLSYCLDSKSSLGRIDASRREAEVLGINKTPTFVINGRVVPGPSASTFSKIVDEALANASTPR